MFPVQRGRLKGGVCRVHLDAPSSFTTLGTPGAYRTGLGYIDERAEVGLLTRRIRIEGEDEKGGPYALRGALLWCSKTQRPQVLLHMQRFFFFFFFPRSLYLPNSAGVSLRITWLVAQRQACILPGTF